MDSHSTNSVIDTLHFSVPPVLLTFYSLASAFPQKGTPSPKPSTLLRWLTVFSLLIPLSYVANAGLVIARALIKKGWWTTQSTVIHVISLTFISGMLTLSLLAAASRGTDQLRPAVWGSYFLIVASEAVIVLYEPLPKRNLWRGAWWGISVFRIVCIILCGSLWALLRSRVGPAEDSAEEPLLGDAASNGGRTYGATPSGTSTPSQNGIAKKPETAAEKTKQKEGWWAYVKSFSVLLPYLWPRNDVKLQLIVIVSFVLLLLQRWVNVLVPRQLGIVTDELSEENHGKGMWTSVLMYVLFRFLQGNMGVLGAVRSVIWIPVYQYTYRSLSTSSYEHVMSLSLDFHLSKKIGEVLQALSNGTSINSVLEQVLFQIAPTIVDLLIAIAYFSVKFDAYQSFVVACVTVSYLYFTVKITEWRTAVRRDMVTKSRAAAAIKTDSVSNYETVKYFNAEDFEFDRFREAIRTVQKSEYTVMSSLNALNVTQGLIFTLGILASCLLSAYRVSQGKDTVGDFVTVLTYLVQLQQPLNFFGMYYRSIQQNLVDAERMLELFNQKPTVVDSPDAHDLELSEGGEIVFDNVHFAYDKRKAALIGLNFQASAGETIALVGESGGGKSTILRLLFRSYDVDSGSITIDRQDIRDVTLNSLRKHIAVVPQDCVLFNESIMYNIRYAKPEATEEEVYEAARAAQIHERILSFPDKYETKVGDRGLRLSGGEKQRVAIARAILKDAKIILLDEATSALDTTTEREIQSALATLRQGRTTFTIAHRLSTITDADKILVLQNGRLVEAGGHDELILHGNGTYRSMWEKQIRAEKERARKADEKVDEAERGFLEDLGEGSGSGTPVKVDEHATASAKTDVVVPDEADVRPASPADTAAAVLAQAGLTLTEDGAVADPKDLDADHEEDSEPEAPAPIETEDVGGEEGLAGEAAMLPGAPVVPVVPVPERGGAEADVEDAQTQPEQAEQAEETEPSRTVSLLRSLQHGSSTESLERLKQLVLETQSNEGRLRELLGEEPMVWSNLVTAVQGTSTTLKEESSETIKNLLTFARNLLAAGQQAQDNAGDANLDKTVESVLQACLANADNAASSNLITTSLQVLSNMIAGNAQQKERVWMNWVAYANEEFVNSLFAFSSKQAVLPLLFFTWNSISEKASLRDTLLSTSSGKALLRQLSMIADDSFEESQSDAFELTYYIIASVIKNGGFDELYIVAKSEHHVVSDAQLNILKITDAMLDSQQIDLTQQPQFPESLMKIFKAIADRSSFLMKALNNDQSTNTSNEKMDVTDATTVWTGVVLLLQTLTHLCSDTSGKETLLKNGVLETTIALLGAANTYVARRTIKASGSVSSSPHDPTAEADSMKAFAFVKRDAVKLLGTLCYKSRSVQDEIRRLHGVELILSQCNVDDDNPYLREHAVFCVRNLLEDNAENQALVAEMEAIKAMPSEALEGTGIAPIIADGKVKLEVAKTEAGRVEVEEEPTSTETEPLLSGPPSAAAFASSGLSSEEPASEETAQGEGEEPGQEEAGAEVMSPTSSKKKKKKKKRGGKGR
ncbi:ATP-binding cassette-type vacuolar membrane transporter Hmt1 [Saitoella coloradoensis]